MFSVFLPLPRQSWEFLKENKKVKKKENTLATKKVRFKKNDNFEEKRRKEMENAY